MSTNEKQSDSEVERQLVRMASRFQELRTGHIPTAVTVVLQGDTLVVTLEGALVPAEKALAMSPAGAAQVQEFHRQLFANSNADMQQEITRITGRQVREAAAEIEPATGAVVHTFTTGAMVQVFLLSQAVTPDSGTGTDGVSIEAIQCADDDGLRVTPAPIFQDDASP